MNVDVERMDYAAVPVELHDNESGNIVGTVLCDLSMVRLTSLARCMTFVTSIARRKQSHPIFQKVEKNPFRSMCFRLR